jgi:hypothetical protein
MATGIGVGIAGDTFQEKAGVGMGPDAFTNLYSVEFDGVDESLDNASSVPGIGTTSFSINFWVYRLADSGADEYIMFSDATNDWEIIINGTNDRMRWLSSPWSDISTGTVAVGAWEMWTFAVDRPGGAGFSRWYRNAVLLDSKAINDSTDFSAGAAGFHMGRKAAAYSFNGRLDECSIWNKELSAGEITTLYNSGEPTDLKAESFAANLINWWRMGDPSGTGSYPTIADAQGSLNLTMTNMTSANINTNVPT